MVDAEGKIPVRAIRPVSVMSAFWRLWASAWVTASPVQEWISKFKHENIIHGPYSLGAEAAASCLHDALAHEHNFMTSLDFQEAFDTTEAFLQRIGWPIGITKVLGSVWTSQNRFIQFDGHTHEKPLLAHRSTPQGCPFAPAVLCLWLTAGVKYIENSTGPISNRHLTIYVDDRTFTTRTWSQAEHQIKLWKEWSDTVGLKSPRQKSKLLLQVNATSKCCKNAALRNGFSRMSLASVQLRSLNAGPTVLRNNRGLRMHEPVQSFWPQPDCSGPDCWMHGKSLSFPKLLMVGFLDPLPLKTHTVSSPCCLQVFELVRTPRPF